MVGIKLSEVSRGANSAAEVGADAEAEDRFYGVGAPTPAAKTSPPGPPLGVKLPGLSASQFPPQPGDVILYTLRVGGNYLESIRVVCRPGILSGPWQAEIQGFSVRGSGHNPDAAADDVASRYLVLGAAIQRQAAGSTPFTPRIRPDVAPRSCPPPHPVFDHDVPAPASRPAALIPPAATILAHEGAKYLREVRCLVTPGALAHTDVYGVLVAFGVTCPATAHAAKKLLCAGQRGKGDRLADLRGAAAAVSRAIELELSNGGAK